MARSGVTQNQVNRAADALLQAGERPTIERIRAALGTGSQSTLMRLLDSWWSDVGQRLSAQEAKLALPGAPASVIDAASALWTTAVQQAQALADAALASAKSELASHTQALVDRESEIRGALTQAQEAASDAHKAQVLAKTRLTDIERLAGQQAAQLADLQRQRDQLLGERDLAVQRLTAASEQLTAQASAALADRQALEAQQRVHEERWAKDIDRARQEALKLQTRLTRVEHDASAAAREAITQQEALRAAVRIAEREQVAATTQLAARDSEIARLHEQLALAAHAKAVQPTRKRKSKPSTAVTTKRARTG